MSDVPIELWPSGSQWTIGILDRTPDHLARTHGVEFSHGQDDLDDFVSGRLSDSQIGDFRLFRHLGSPDAGLEVQVDTSVSRDDALSAVWRATGLDIRAFTWVTPYRSFEQALVSAGSRREGDVLFPPFRSQIIDSEGQLRFVHIYPHDEDIRYLGGADTAPKDGDQVSILPALAAGPGSGYSESINVEPKEAAQARKKTRGSLTWIVVTDEGTRLRARRFLNSAGGSLSSKPDATRPVRQTKKQRVASTRKRAATTSFQRALAKHVLRNFGHRGDDDRVTHVIYELDVRRRS